VTSYPSAVQFLIADIVRQCADVVVLMCDFKVVLFMSQNLKTAGPLHITEIL